MNVDEGNLDTSPEISGERVRETTEQDALLKSSVEFARHITSHWPQVNEKTLVVEVAERASVTLPDLSNSLTTPPRLNYYFSGSLAVMLLAQADAFEEIDCTKLPEISTLDRKEIPPSARAELQKFARKIGDLDFTPLDEYKKSEHRLRKGGGGPTFDELSSEARLCLKQGEYQIKVMCDPVSSCGNHRIVRVNITGQEYYVASPDAIIAYKVLHMIQKYSGDINKFNRDFATLWPAMKQMYSVKALQQTITEVLNAYESSKEQLAHRMQTMYEPEVATEASAILCNPQVSPEINEALSFLVDTQTAPKPAS